MHVQVFEHLHHHQGWLSPGTVTIDDHGMITAVDPGHGDQRANLIKGITIPGMANLHSHAFQRAMLGLTEFRNSGAADSFWTWRERMYQLAESMTPDDLEAVAAQLYVEMLEAGMTAVGEFHYLHHDFDGQRYARPTEMSERIFAAANQTGIVLTHLPVLYLKGGFGKAPLAQQSRFTHADIDDYLKFYQALKPLISSHPHGRLGVAPHSLRAVDATSLSTLVSAISSDTPVHIHIAEQIKEVEDAKSHLGTSPVQWLLDQHAVDERWCLIHATHMNDDEISGLAKSGAVAGLCPSTEANLGDGIFGARRYLDAKGRIGIGTDSHVNVSVAAELRLLEYGQRLRDWQRNVLASSEQPSVGRRLLDESLCGGAKALAQPMGRIEVGCRADFVVLDNTHPRMVEHPLASALDAWIFGHTESVVDRVMVAGQWIVENGRHKHADQIYQSYRKVVRRLWS